MFPIYTPAQLATYLRSLRKAQGLTQSELGAQLGVTRARVSEIEIDPSNVGFAQLQRILHLLQAKFVIETPVGESKSRKAGRVKSPKGEW